MSIPMPPSPPTRPVFGAWAEKPRSEWTSEQTLEFDEKWAEFKRQSQALTQWLEGLPGQINGAIKG